MQLNYEECAGIRRGCQLIQKSSSLGFLSSVFLNCRSCVLCFERMAQFGLQRLLSQCALLCSLHLILHCAFCTVAHSVQFVQCRVHGLFSVHCGLFLVPCALSVASVGYCQNAALVCSHTSVCICSVYSVAFIVQCAYSVQCAVVQCGYPVCCVAILCAVWLTQLSVARRGVIVRMRAT